MGASECSGDDTELIIMSESLPYEILYLTPPGRGYGVWMHCLSALAAFTRIILTEGEPPAPCAPSVHFNHLERLQIQTNYFRYL